MPAARQNRSKLADTSSQALPTAPISVAGNTVGVVLILFMALLSFRGISTPSLRAQGEQRRSSYFNISRGNPADQQNDADQRDQTEIKVKQHQSCKRANTRRRQCRENS